MEKNLKRSLVYLVFLTLIVTVVFVIIVCINFSIFEKIDWAATGQVGDFFGGVIGTLVGAIGFILIYLSFVSQTNSQKEQEKQFLKSQIESRFFELIKLHKENVNDIIYSPKKTTEIRGRKAVDFIYQQIEQCYGEIGVFFEFETPERIYTSKYLEKIRCYQKERSGICLLNLAQIDIAYSIVFFGTSHTDLQALYRLLSRYYDEAFIKLICRYVRLKPLSEDLMAKWRIIEERNLTVLEIKDAFEKLDERTAKESLTLEEISGYEDHYIVAFRDLAKIEKLNKYYGGHQYKLGHYFRHLFQTVKYIDEKTILKYGEKYDYIKTLRAQLSTIEQYIVFFNSLSFMGRAWEFDNIVDNTSNKHRNKWLITKYNFLKNIPDLYPFEGVLEINKYYPDVHFEFGDKPSTRASLEEVFTATDNLQDQYCCREKE
ncbi:putative phage abortive infection protein [Sphingobacterium lactis]|nr:putative phage abortive infection protein [Sphingobacterium lactis]